VRYFELEFGRTSLDLQSMVVVAAAIAKLGKSQINNPRDILATLLVPRLQLSGGED